MKKQLKYFLFGLIFGAVVGFFPPFHYLSLPIVIPLSKILELSEFSAVILISTVILTSAIMFGFLGLLISLFRKDKNQNIVSDGSKMGFIVALVGGIVTLLPSITNLFRGLRGANDFYLPARFIFLYGLLIFISSFLLRKEKTLKTGSTICIILGLLPFLVWFLSLVSETMAFYLFMGELFERGFLLAVIILISSVLSIIGGIIGFRKLKNNNP